MILAAQNARMAGAALTDPAAARAELTDRRHEVLTLLRRAGGRLGAAEVAEQLGLHLTTARFHLEALVEAGRVERASEVRTSPGRPKIVYTTRVGAERDDGVRSYRLLAEMLVSFVAGASPDPLPAAVRAGREWGGHLVERPPPFRRVDTAGAARHLVGLLDAIGFDPELAEEAGGHVQVRLRRCPFREVAERHPEVVCGLHLGLMRGALEQVRAPVTAESLAAFVEPDLCLARLRAVPRPGSAPDGVGGVSVAAPPSQRTVTT